MIFRGGSRRRRETLATACGRSPTRTRLMRNPARRRRTIETVWVEDAAPSGGNSSPVRASRRTGSRRRAVLFTAAGARFVARRKGSRRTCSRMRNRRSRFRRTAGFSRMFSSIPMTRRNRSCFSFTKAGGSTARSGAITTRFSGARRIPPSVSTWGASRNGKMGATRIRGGEGRACRRATRSPGSPSLNSTGRVSWDKTGVTGRSDPAADPAALLSCMGGRQRRQAGEGTARRDSRNPQTPAEGSHARADQPIARAFPGFLCAETRPKLEPLHSALAALRKQRDEFNAAIPASSS